MPKQADRYELDWEPNGPSGEICIKSTDPNNGQVFHFPVFGKFNEDLRKELSQPAMFGGMDQRARQMVFLLCEWAVWAVRVENKEACSTPPELSLALVSLRGINDRTRRILGDLLKLRQDFRKILPHLPYDGTLEPGDVTEPKRGPEELDLCKVLEALNSVPRQHQPLIIEGNENPEPLDMKRLSEELRLLRGVEKIILPPPSSKGLDRADLLLTAIGYLNEFEKRTRGPQVGELRNSHDRRRRAAWFCRTPAIAYALFRALTEYSIPHVRPMSAYKIIGCFEKDFLGNDNIGYGTSGDTETVRKQVSEVRNSPRRPSIDNILKNLWAIFSRFEEPPPSSPE